MADRASGLCRLLGPTFPLFGGDKGLGQAMVRPENDRGSAADQTSRQLRGSSGLVLGRVVALLLGMGTQVLLVRALSRSDYGAFAYTLALIPLLRLVVSLGMSQATPRFLSIYDEEDDRPRAAGLIVMQALVVLSAGAVLWLAVVGLQGVLSGALIDDPLAVQLLVVMVLLAPIEAFDRLFEAIFAAFSRPGAIFVRKYIIGPSLKILAVIVVLLLQGSVVVLAVGYVLGGVIGLAVYLRLARELLRTRGLLDLIRRRKFVIPFRPVFRFSVPLLTAEVLAISMTTISVVILGAFAGTEEVAAYRAVFPVARLNHVVLWTFALLFFPLASRMYAQRDNQGMRQAYQRSSVWVAVLTFPAFIATTAVADQTTVLLFGERYASSAPLLAVMSAGHYLNAVFGFNALTLQTYGRLRFVVVANMSGAALNVLLSLFLAPRYGAMGVAVANTSTYVFINVVNQVGLRNTIGAGLLDRSSALGYARVALVAAVVWAWALIFEPGVIAAEAVAVAASLALLLWTRRLLRLGEVFPEAQSMPILKHLV